MTDQELDKWTAPLHFARPLPAVGEGLTLSQVNAPARRVTCSNANNPWRLHNPECPCLRVKPVRAVEAWEGELPAIIPDDWSPDAA